MMEKKNISMIGGFCLLATTLQPAQGFEINFPLGEKTGPYVFQINGQDTSLPSKGENLLESLLKVTFAGAIGFTGGLFCKNVAGDKIDPRVAYSLCAFPLYFGGLYTLFPENENPETNKEISDTKNLFLPYFR